MRNLPIYPNAKANVLVDQRNRWYAWAQAMQDFNSLLGQRHFMPMTGERTTRQGLDMDLIGGVTGAMEGPVNTLVCPGGDAYLEIPDTEPLVTELRCINPVFACWVRNDATGVANRYFGLHGYGVGKFEWRIGINAAGNFFVDFSTNGIAVTAFTPGNPSDFSLWNFYAFQYQSDDVLNMIVNDTVTTVDPNLGAAIFVGTGGYRIGWRVEGSMALVSYANDASANCVQKLLGLFYHSRYAFRDDW